MKYSKLLGNHQKFIGRLLLCGLLGYLVTHTTGDNQTQIVGTLIGLIIGGSGDQVIRKMRNK